MLTVATDRRIEGGPDDGGGALGGVGDEPRNMVQKTR